MLELTNLSWLDLPAIDMGPLSGMSLMYGADRIIAEYTGQSLVPTGIRGEWQHGWHPVHHQVSPFWIGGLSLSKRPRRRSWVARADEVRFLESRGYRAKAIGLPICYLPHRDYHRQPGSLLVMPAHSSSFVPIFDSEEDRQAAYVRYAGSLDGQFPDVAVCLHEECIRQGLWVGDFEQIGFTVIQGASVRDRNSLERVRALMSQFEYVTSNVLGSHIAYAAAFGAKVSIAGPIHQWDRKLAVQEPLYRENPALLDILDTEEQLARDNFPFLFVEPSDAKTQVEWGRAMIGMDNVLSPREMVALFRIDPVSEWARRSVQAARRVAGGTLRALKLRRAAVALN